ncbi:hypothetical protein ACFX13_004469 [Malus domestica]
MGAKQSYKLLLVIAVAVVVMLATVCRGSSVGHTPSANEEVLDEFVEFKDQSRQTDDARAAEKAREGKEGSESWTEWAKEKITGGLGLKQDNENFLKQDDENFLKDSSKKASDATYDTASAFEDFTFVLC